MSQRFGKPSAPYRSPFGNRRDGVPASPSQSSRRLHRSHLPSASMTTATPPLRPPRPDSLQSTPMPMQPPTRPVASKPKPDQPTPTPAPRKIQSKIFCASIRDHAIWAAAIPLLLADRAESKWETARLNSHDLAVHIAPPHGEAAGGSTVRFALVTATDVGQPDLSKKLHRLAARKNGSDAVVLFLLSRCNADGQAVDTMAAYKQLQLDTAVSILPLAAVETLPATVAAFCGQLTAPLVDAPGASNRRIYNLLRMYFGNPVPLSADEAKKLVAACEAEMSMSSRQAGVTLKDVIAFCNDLKIKSPGRLEEILGTENAVLMDRF
ncbi:hypothetical protein F503_07217 [Ophiostoma piceae UAMH 11346]|uniref:Uncharacterized protein n=1 Tax=Ophiostoma piceae (strain UAMH 11346) TaxID=1262450 RepID=S3CBT8_OPHP1|nr:hypothetical protein F503_07217 [Ophiostoma piceae UAMH 11346]